MLGVTVGNIGLHYDEFCDLTPDEFSHIYKAYGDEREARYKDDWNRMSMLAAISLQPYSKNHLTPHKLLPFPWDEESQRTKKEIPKVSKEEALQRFEEVLKKVDN